MSDVDPVVGRHCDLLEQAWQLMQGAWNKQTDDAWRTGVKTWRLAHSELWVKHCGHDPGPAPHGLPLIRSDTPS